MNDEMYISGEHDMNLYRLLNDEGQYKGLVPISVSRGRKFKGRGFITEIFQGMYGLKAKILCLTEAKPVYATLSFCEFDESITPDEIEQAKNRMANAEQEYVNSTIEWCRSKSTSKNENDVLRFARNVIRKNHPEIDVEKYIKLENVIDIGQIVHDTIQWAMTLKSRPGRYYGKMVEGGKPFTKKRYATIAWRSCVRKGITKSEGFEAAWMLNITLFGLPDVRPQTNNETEE